MKSDHGKTPVNIRAFPRLDATEIGPTLNAVHAYTQVLGDWLGSSLPKRKHWWQLTVQPSIGGISSGLVQAGIDFEFELDLAKDRLLGRVAGGEEFSEPLSGRPAKELAELVQGFLLENGIDPELIPADKGRERDTLATPDYSVGIAASLGAKVAGQDIANEEYADSSMNFGFTFGDEGIPEPYFYITAYPLPDALPDHTLPPGTYWHNEGFSGAVLPYRSLLENSNPADYLVDLWNDLLTAGRKYL